MKKRLKKILEVIVAIILGIFGGIALAEILKRYIEKHRRVRQMKKYVFTCTNRECKCLKEGVGLYFITDDIKKAEKHSRENNSPMWVSRMSEKEYDGIEQTKKKLGVKR